MFDGLWNDSLTNRFSEAVKKGLSGFVGNDGDPELLKRLSDALTHEFRLKGSTLNRFSLPMGEEQLPMIEQMVNHALNEIKQNPDLVKAGKNWVRIQQEFSAVEERQSGNLEHELGKTLSYRLDDLESELEEARQAFDVQFKKANIGIQKQWNVEIKHHYANPAIAEMDAETVAKFHKALDTRLEEAEQLVAEELKILIKPNVFASVENVWMGVKHLMTGQGLSEGMRGKAATGLFAGGLVSIGLGVRDIIKKRTNDETGENYHRVGAGASKIGGGVAALAAALKLAEKNLTRL